MPKPPDSWPGPNFEQRFIDELPNLGPKSAEWLARAGVRNWGDLWKLGAVGAYLQVKKRQPKASLNLLWAIAAGIQNRDWRSLTEGEKKDLVRELEEEGRVYF